MTNPETHTSSPTRYWDALRQHWVVVALVVIVAVAAAAAYSFTAKPRYETSADILVMPVDTGDQTFTGINVLREGTESRSVLTAAKLLRTEAVANRVKRRLGLDEGPQSLLDRIDVQPQQQSNILTVVGKASDAARAAALANGFAQALINQRTAQFQQQLGFVVDRLEARLDVIPKLSPEAAAISQQLGALTALKGANDPTLAIASPAHVPESPVWPRPVASIVVAFMAALLLASGAALALEVLNPRVRHVDALVLEHRLPVLARVPRMNTREVSEYLSSQGLPAEVREAYRRLRVNLATAGSDFYPRTILITSAVAGDGKTMTAVNLATTLAKSNLRVILVDGDLRRPMIGSIFGVPSLGGNLASILLETENIDDVLVPAPGYGDQLRLVVSTPERGLLIDLLQSDRVDRALAALRLAADVIVIDSPPLNEVADALILADSVDAVVVAVRLGHTGRDQLLELRHMLAGRGVSPAGFVVTTRRRARRGYRPYRLAGELGDVFSAQREPAALEPTPETRSA